MPSYVPTTASSLPVSMVSSRTAQLTQQWQQEEERLLARAMEAASGEGSRGEVVGVAGAKDAVMFDSEREIREWEASRRRGGAAVAGAGSAGSGRHGRGASKMTEEEDEWRRRARHDEQLRSLGVDLRLANGNRAT